MLCNTQYQTIFMNRFILIFFSFIILISSANSKNIGYYSKPGININYPEEIILSEFVNKRYTRKISESQYSLLIQIEAIENIGKETCGYGIETTNELINSLESGKVGPNICFGVKTKIRHIKNINAQESFVLSQFEATSIMLAKRLIFFYKGHRIIVRLYADQHIKIATEKMSKYFFVDEEGLKWNYKLYNGQESELFANDVENGNCPKELKEWLLIWNDIINSINLL